MVLVGCSGRTVATEDSSALPQPAADSTGAPKTTFYHLEGKIDAVNLALEPDGTFHWTINGCDFFGGDCGVWVAEGSGAILTPHSSLPSFDWVNDGTFAAKVVRVTLRPGPAGDQVTASGVQTDGQPFKQTWKQGRVCPECGGLGPTALYPCSDPLPTPANCTQQP
jgi:hypothetical protein